MLHGEAVLLDVLISTLIARAWGMLSDKETNRIFCLIDALGITLDVSILDPGLLYESLEERTYHRNGLQRVPIPHGIGDCIFLNDICADEIESIVKSLEDWITIKHEII